MRAILEKHICSGCIRQRVEHHGVLGYDPSQDNDRKLKTIHKLHGIQSPTVLRLRTCEQHRMRVLLLINLSVLDRWANGTIARLLSCDSWTGCCSKMVRSQGGGYLAKEVHLDGKSSLDYNVRVIRDTPKTTSKSIRHDSKDCAIVGVSTDHARNPRTGRLQEWAQVQLVLAYALTIHKSQGVTLPSSYPSLHGTFGFGMPYTIATRTPSTSNMFFVGVPPSDVLESILKKNHQGKTLLDAERERLAALLRNDEGLDKLIADKLRTGELRAEAAEDSQEDHRRHALREKLRADLQGWHDRLDADAGLKAMVRVSEGFKMRDGRAQPYSNRIGTWKSLAGTLQGDSHDKKKIVFFHAVATKWMVAPGLFSV